MTLTDSISSVRGKSSCKSVSNSCFYNLQETLCAYFTVWSTIEIVFYYVYISKLIADITKTFVSDINFSVVQ